MANITSISPEEFLSQTYNSSDARLISSFEVNNLFTTSSYIESHIYDTSDTLINSELNFIGYSVLNEGRLSDSNQLSNIQLNPETDLLDLGYSAGDYNTYYNFLNKKIGSSIELLYISEISSDRTELRLDSNNLPELDLREQTTQFVQEREDSEYFIDFYINLGDNRLIIANNITLEDSDPSNPTILIKLYEPLPIQFTLNTELWIVTPLSTPRAYYISFPPEDIEFITTVPLKGPNFNLDIKDQVNNSTVELSYSNLITTTLTSSRDQINTLLNKKEININIDYTQFSEFIHFSSAQSRLENFYYKIGLLETYSSSISLISQITGSTSSSPSISGSKALLESQISSIITNFDEYEYFLYYSSGSYAWPKTTSTPPYKLATTGSSEVLTWLGSSIEGNPNYGGLLLSASKYDENNQDYLYYSIPEYLREDEANQPYFLFIDMVAQHYDNIWIYVKDVSEKFNADNRLTYGVSKDLVADTIRDFGVKLYQNNFSIDDLYTAFLGLTPEGGLFPFPNITGSLPTPTGYEYIDTKVSASNEYIPMDDVNKSLYKRIYHNLPYLLKSKGTIPGLRSLITSYGIPDTILKISEFGGKDKVNTNDWDLYSNNFNYSFNNNGNNFISSSFTLNNSWTGSSNLSNPSTVEFRFKSNETVPTNVSQSIFSIYSASILTSDLIIEYTGSGLTSASYSGASIDPNYQYATLKWIPTLLQ